MNLKEKWNKQNNSIKLLLKKLKRHDTAVVATAVVIATALCGGLIYLSTPVVTATAKEEIIQDELVNNEKTVEKLDELKEYLNGIDKTVAENQKNIKSIHDKSNNSSKETNEITERMTNNVTEKIVGLDKDMKELRQLISNTVASIDSLKKSMEKGDSDNAQKLGDSFKNLYAQLQSIENKFNTTQEKNTELINDVRNTINSGNKNLSKEMLARYNELLARLEETDAKLSNQNNSSMEDYKNQMNALSNEFKTRFAELGDALTDEMATVKGNLDNVNSGISAAKGEISQKIDTRMDSHSKEMDKKFTDWGDTLNSEMAEVKGDLDNVNSGISNATKDISQKIDTGADGINKNIDSKFGDFSGNIQVDLDGLKKYIGDEIGEVNRNLRQVFTYVSDGKRLLASALLTKGVVIEPDAKFPEIAKAILSIKTEYTIDDIPGKVVYTYHYHNDGVGTECDDAMVEEARQGGCYNKAVNHVHTKECEETRTKYTYSTYAGVERQNDAAGEYDSTGKQKAWFYCSYCKKRWKDTDPSHRETTYRMETVTGRHGIVLKQETEITYICNREVGDLEGYVTDCGYVHGQVVGAHITFPGKYSDYDTTTGNGTGSNTPVSDTTPATVGVVSVSRDDDISDEYMDVEVSPEEPEIAPGENTDPAKEASDTETSDTEASAPEASDKEASGADPSDKETSDMEPVIEDGE